MAAVHPPKRLATKVSFILHLKYQTDRTVQSLPYHRVISQGESHRETYEWTHEFTHIARCTQLCSLHLFSVIQLISHIQGEKGLESHSFPSSLCSTTNNLLDKF